MQLHWLTVAESFVAMFCIIPIPESDVTAVISRDSTTVDDDGEDDEPEDSNDFDYAEDKFDWTRSLSDCPHGEAFCHMTYPLRNPSHRRIER